MATPLPIFLAQLTASIVAMDPLTARVAAKTGDQMVAKARKDVAKDTRSLMRSIKRSNPLIGAGSITILLSAGGPSQPIEDVDYAGYIEEGTGVMAARPFMRPAVNKFLPQFVNELADVHALLAAGRPGRVAGSVRR